MDIPPIPPNADRSIVKAVLDVTFAKVKLGAAVVNNAVKAINRLCGTSVGWVTARMENSTSLHDAKTNANVRLIEAHADALAKEFLDAPEFVRAALQQQAINVAIAQSNIDAISRIALDDIVSGEELPADSDPATEEISSDWLNRFHDHAKNMSSAEMQLSFGKILAGEILKPGSFSIKAINLLSELDTATAKLFRRFCSMAVSFSMPGLSDARVVSPGGNAAANSLRQFGLSFDNLNRLQEHGLIIGDYNSYMDYAWAIAIDGRIPVPFKFNGVPSGLVATRERKAESKLLFHGVAATVAAHQLMQVVELEDAKDFGAEFEKFLESQGLKLAIVKNWAS